MNTFSRVIGSLSLLVMALCALFWTYELEQMSSADWLGSSDPYYETTYDDRVIKDLGLPTPEEVEQFQHMLDEFYSMHIYLSNHPELLQELYGRR